MKKTKVFTSTCFGIIVIAAGIVFVWQFDTLRNCGEVNCSIALITGVPFLPLLAIPYEYNSSWLASFSLLRPFAIAILFGIGSLYSLFCIALLVRKFRLPRPDYRLVLLFLGLATLSCFFVFWAKPPMVLESRLDYCDRGRGAWSSDTYEACITDVIYYIASVHSLSICPRNNSVFPYLHVQKVSQECINELVNSNLKPFCSNRHTWSCFAWRQLTQRYEIPCSLPKCQESYLR